MWGKIAHPYPTLNRYTVWEWIDNFIPHNEGLGLTLTFVSKRSLSCRMLFKTDTCNPACVSCSRQLGGVYIRYSDRSYGATMIEAKYALEIIFTKATPYLASSVMVSYVVSFERIWVKIHDDVIKWKHFPRYWPFVREIHRSPVNLRWISHTKASDAELWCFIWSASE